jgi:hypothetical protein
MTIGTGFYSIRHGVWENFWVGVCTDEGFDEIVAAQEKYLDAVRFKAGKLLVNSVGEIVGKLKWKRHSLTASE